MTVGDGSLCFCFTVDLEYAIINERNLNLAKECVQMNNENPKKNSIISWIVLGIGALFAVIGAMTTQENKVNLLLIIGGLIVVVGIVYHLLLVRCPYCGQSLAGYNPLPDECPKCHNTFER